MSSPDHGAPEQYGTTTEQSSTACHDPGTWYRRHSSAQGCHSACTTLHVTVEGGERGGWPSAATHDESLLDLPEWEGNSLADDARPLWAPQLPLSPIMAAPGAARQHGIDEETLPHLHPQHVPLVCEEYSGGQTRGESEALATGHESLTNNTGHQNHSGSFKRANFSLLRELRLKAQRSGVSLEHRIAEEPTSHDIPPSLDADPEAASIQPEDGAQGTASGGTVSSAIPKVTRKPNPTPRKPIWDPSTQFWYRATCQNCSQGRSKGCDWTDIGHCDLDHKCTHCTDRGLECVKLYTKFNKRYRPIHMPSPILRPPRRKPVLVNGTFYNRQCKVCSAYRGQILCDWALEAPVGTPDLNRDCTRCTLQDETCVKVERGSGPAARLAKGLTGE